MLIWLLRLVCHQLLGELIHKVGSHADYLGIVEVLLHAAEVLGDVVPEVAISYVVILILQCDVEGGQVRIWLSRCVLLLCELIALLNLGLLEQHPAHHCVFVQDCLDVL